MEVLKAQGDFGDHSEVRKVTNRKTRRTQGEMNRFKTIISEMRNTIQNTFVKMVNVLSRIDVGQITAGKLRGVGKLYNLEEETEIAQKERKKGIGKLGETGKERRIRRNKMQEMEENGGKNSKLKIKKLRKEIEKKDMEELIIDRPKSNDEANRQIEFLANEFQRLEENEEEAESRGESEEESKSSEEEMEMQFPEKETGIPKREERPRMKRRENR